MTMVKSYVVVLCLEYEVIASKYAASLLAKLAKKDVVCKANTVAQATRYLTSTVRPRAVIIRSEGNASDVSLLIVAVD